MGSTTRDRAGAGAVATAFAAGALLLSAGAWVGASDQKAGTASAPTFYKDVVPILQDKCQSCHRSGEAAPMALVTYEQTRPWAAKIAAAVEMKMMPPWFADPRYGRFSNDPSLSAGADCDDLGLAKSGSACGRFARCACAADLE